MSGINAFYRISQRNGQIGLNDSIRSHILSIQNALENTVNDHYRKAFWAILGRAQLLQRLNIVREQELAKAKTWNESAISSAQQSGDPFLLAACIGHLAHAYMLWQHDNIAARSLINQARDIAENNPALQGWFHILLAAIAAKEGNRRETDYHVQHSLEFVNLTYQEDQDPYYTDFNLAGIEAFAANCFLNIGLTNEAHGLLVAINLAHMAENRHASTFYDLARVHLFNGELDMVEVYAYQAVDKAIETNRNYIIPRFIKMTSQIEQQAPNEPHAKRIRDRAIEALA